MLTRDPYTQADYGRQVFASLGLILQHISIILAVFVLCENTKTVGLCSR